MRMNKKLTALAMLAHVFSMSPLQAKISNPQEIISRQDAHCQSPNWSPDGKNLIPEIVRSLSTNQRKQYQCTWPKL